MTDVNRNLTTTQLQDTQNQGSIKSVPSQGEVDKFDSEINKPRRRDSTVLKYRTLGQSVMAKIAGTSTQKNADQLGIFDLWKNVEEASKGNSTVADESNYKAITTLQNLTPSQHTLSQEVLGKIFSDPKFNTIENQELLKNIANDPNSKLGQDKNGNLWSAQVQDDGTVFWVQSTLQGEIIDGGMIAAHPELTANTVSSFHQLTEGTMAIIAGTPAQETLEQLGVFNLWRETKQAFQTNSITANSGSFQAIQNLRNLTPNKHTISSEAMNTIFGDPSNNMANTLENQKLLKDIANDPNSKLGQDKNGDLWSSRLLGDGSIVWTQSNLQGDIVKGGIVAAHPELTANTVQGYDQLVRGTLAMIVGTPAQASVEQSGIFNGWQEAHQAYQTNSATANSDSFQAIQNLRNLTPSEHKISKQAMGNIFGNPNNNIGNTAVNQELLISIANDPNSKISQGKNGDLWSSRLLGDGSVVWTQSTLQGELVDGGIIAANPELTAEDILINGGNNSIGLSGGIAVQGGIIYQYKLDGHDGLVTQSSLHPNVRIYFHNESGMGRYQEKKATGEWVARGARDAEPIYNEQGALSSYKTKVERLTNGRFFGDTAKPLISRQSGAWITDDIMSWSDVYSAIDNTKALFSPGRGNGTPLYTSNIDQDGITYINTGYRKDEIRINKSTPNPNENNAQYYYVTVMKSGEYLDRSGNPIKGTLGENSEQAHIPLDEFLAWKTWDKPRTKGSKISSKVKPLPPAILAPVNVTTDDPGVITLTAPSTETTELRPPNYDYFPSAPTYDLDPILSGGFPSVYNVIVSLDALDAPDGDGKTEFAEANWHRRNMKGENLHADANTVDISVFTPNMFTNAPNPDGSITQSFNLGTLSYLEQGGSLNDALVYGSIQLTLLPNSGGKVTIGNDIYDFDIHGDIFQGAMNKKTYRNLETIGANLLIGGGDPFRIIFHGEGQLGPDNPK